MMYCSPCGVCPGCQAESLPILQGEANAACCQNGECRRVYNREGLQVGRWTEGYKEFAAL